MLSNDTSGGWGVSSGVDGQSRAALLMTSSNTAGNFRALAPFLKRKNIILSVHAPDYIKHEERGKKKTLTQKLRTISS